MESESSSPLSIEKSTATASHLNERTQTRQLPGEALIIDNDSKSSGFHLKDGVVLVPAPSSDINDPLNWSTRRKYLDIGLVCFWTFMLGSATLSPNVAAVDLMMHFKFGPTFLNIGTAVMIFNLGVFNVLFSPLSQKYGRRPVYLLSTLICIVSQIVSATSTNKAAFTVGRVLLGAGAAPFEQLPALTVNDIFFVHQRGFGLSLYVLALTTGSFLGPIATGYVIPAQGWRWLYWWHAIILGIVFVALFVGLEETTFDRTCASRALDNAEGERRLRGERISFWTSRKLFLDRVNEPSLFRLIGSSFQVMHLPIILWCGFMYGLAVTWLSIMAVTLAEVFMAPPYLFSVSSVGLVNFAPMIGACLSLFLGGAGTDRFLLWKARRRGGMMKSEDRLYCIFIGGPLMGAGLWLYGVGAAQGISWVGLVFGMGLIGCGLPISAELALGYSIEAYPLLASEVSVAVIFIRNCIGCAFTFAISPWIHASDLQNAFIAVGVLALIGMVSGTGLIAWGEKCRQSSAERYWSLARYLNRAG